MRRCAQWTRHARKGSASMRHRACADAAKGVSWVEGASVFLQVLVHHPAHKAREEALGVVNAPVRESDHVGESTFTDAFEHCGADGFRRKLCGFSLDGPGFRGFNLVFCFDAWGVCGRRIKDRYVRVV